MSVHEVHEWLTEPGDSALNLQATPVSPGGECESKGVDTQDRLLVAVASGRRASDSCNQRKQLCIGTDRESSPT